MKIFKHIAILFFILWSKIGYSEIKPIKFENQCCANYRISDSNDIAAKAQTVYICTGPYAYAYHSTPNCPGLSNCKIGRAHV